MPLTATPGRVPGFHNRNAARSDVVWKLTWLLFPLLFYILIKVFSPIRNACRLAGFSKGPSCLPPRGAPASLMQGSRIKPLPSLPRDPGHPHWHCAGGDAPQHRFSKFIHHQPPHNSPAKTTVQYNLRELSCRGNGWKGVHLFPIRRHLIYEPVPFFLFPVPAVSGKFTNSSHFKHKGTT